MNETLWIKAPFIFIADYVFSEDEVLVVKLFPSYLFFVLTIGAGLVLWIRSGLDFNLNLLFALPFAALIVSIPVTYGLSFWKRRKLSALSIDEISSRIKTADRIKWSEVTKICLRNWQLSIWTDNKRNNLFLSYSQAEPVEEFIRSKTDVPWGTFKTRYSLIVMSFALILGDMILAVSIPASWTASWVSVIAGFAILVFSIGLLVYALLKPRTEST